jgi:Protein of unknown function (DUF2591).
MKTATLTGADLNRAVAMARGHALEQQPRRIGPDSPMVWVVRAGDGGLYELPNYAGDIAVAWPIMKEHKIDLEYQKNGIWAGCEACMNRYGGGEYALGNDDDPQIAAMRCFVASVYGDDVELP